MDLRIGEKYHIRILIIISLYSVSEYNFFIKFCATKNFDKDLFTKIAKFNNAMSSAYTS